MSELGELVKLLIYFMVLICFVVFVNYFAMVQKVNKFNELCGTNVTVDQARWTNLSVTKDCTGVKNGQ